MLDGAARGAQAARSTRVAWSSGCGAPRRRAWHARSIDGAGGRRGRYLCLRLVRHAWSSNASRAWLPPSRAAGGLSHSGSAWEAERPASVLPVPVLVLDAVHGPQHRLAGGAWPQPPPRRILSGSGNYPSEAQRQCAMPPSAPGTVRPTQRAIPISSTSTTRRRLLKGARDSPRNPVLPYNIPASMVAYREYVSPPRFGHSTDPRPLGPSPSTRCPTATRSRPAASARGRARPARSRRPWRTP